MMIPDVLTPEQYYDGVRADDACVRPVKRLMLAVLEDAMRCYQFYANSRNGANRRLFIQAEAWLMDREADGVFSFQNICDTLGIEPACLREGLRRWRLQLLDGMNPRRLARRSPVTRAGRISAPLKRRRRGKASGPAADKHGVAVATGIDGVGFRPETAHRVGDPGAGVGGRPAPHDPAYEVAADDGEVENVAAA